MLRFFHQVLVVAIILRKHFVQFFFVGFHIGIQEFVVAFISEST